MRALKLRQIQLLPDRRYTYKWDAPAQQCTRGSYTATPSFPASGGVVNVPPATVAHSPHAYALHATVPSVHPSGRYVIARDCGAPVAPTFVKTASAGPFENAYKL